MLNLKRQWQSISKPKWLVFEISLILLLGCSHLFYNGWTNTLERNGNWLSSKTELAKGVFSARYFTLTFTALADEQLDLSVAHGFQEIFWKTPSRYADLSLDFKLSSNAFLDVFVNEEEGEREFLRFSNSEKFKSGLFREKEYAFTQQSLFQQLDLKTGVWHQLSIHFSNRAPIVQVDEVPIQLEAKRIASNILGLRGNDQHVWVDNILLKQKDGTLVFAENFERQYSKLKRWGLLLLLFLVLNFCFLITGKHRNKLTILVLNLGLIAVVLLLFFRLYYQDKYPKEYMVNWSGHSSHIERKIPAQTRLDKEIEALKANPDSSIKLMLLGSSQVWGAGAGTKDSDFASHLEKQIAHSCGTHPIRLLNMGVSGFTGANVYDKYAHVWVDVKPDFVVIDLGTNDNDAIDLGVQLRKVLELNQKHGIQTFFILEPNSHISNQLNANHDTMRALAAEFQIPLCDPSPIIHSKVATGFIFWDSVHFTDYGQGIFSDIVWRFLAPYLCPKAGIEGGKDED